MNRHEVARAQTATELRKRIAAFDTATPTPPDLLQRVTATRRPQRREIAAGSPRRWSTVVLAGVAVIGVVIGLGMGVGWQRRRQAPEVPGGRTGVQMTVYNAERGCQGLRTIECGLGFRLSPHQPINAERAVGRLWHGDSFVTECVVLDGLRISDEEGVSSTRWYKIRTRNGLVGFLPAVRTHNTVEIAVCAPADVPS